MISRNSFMAFNSFAPAIILNCEVLPDGTGPIPYESMCCIYITASFQYCAEKVIESFLIERISSIDELFYHQNNWRSNVGRQWLLIPCSGAVKCLDSS